MTPEQVWTDEVAQHDCTLMREPDLLFARVGTVARKHERGQGVGVCEMCCARMSVTTCMGRAFA